MRCVYMFVKRIFVEKDDVVLQDEVIETLFDFSFSYLTKVFFPIIACNTYHLVKSSMNEDTPANRHTQKQESGKKRVFDLLVFLPCLSLSLYSFPYNSIEISRTDLSNSCARTKKKTRARREKTREREKRIAINVNRTSHC